MLILSRKRNERIFIGERIVIQVTELRGDRVWIGITAPDDVRIYREEVLQAMQARGEIGGPSERGREARGDDVAAGGNP